MTGDQPVDGHPDRVEDVEEERAGVTVNASTAVVEIVEPGVQRRSRSDERQMQRVDADADGDPQHDDQRDQHGRDRARRLPRPRRSPDAAVGHERGHQAPRAVGGRDHAEDLLVADDADQLRRSRRPAPAARRRAPHGSASGRSRPGPARARPVGSSGAHRPHDPAQGQHVRRGTRRGRSRARSRRPARRPARRRCRSAPIAPSRMIRMRSPSLSASDEVVGDEDHRLADLVVQPDDLVLHVAADQRVERGERLVEQQHVGVAGERPGQADALLHAAGELVGVGVLVAGEADQLDHLAGPLDAARRLSDAADLEPVARRCRGPGGAAAGRSAGTPSRPCAGAGRAARSSSAARMSSPSNDDLARRSARSAGSGSGRASTCPSRTGP